MRPMFQFAFLQMDWICLDQERLLEIVTPRYFTDSLGNRVAIDIDVDGYWSS